MVGRDNQVKITIGDRDYSISTFLDETTLNRVLDIIEGAISGAEGGQEQKLLSACLHLAYKLDGSSSEYEDRKNCSQDNMEKTESKEM